MTHVIPQSLSRFLEEAPYAQRTSAVDRIFSRCDPECLASASIAQVHAATLSQETLAALGSSWQCGPEVVLKVQHLDMQALMESDIRSVMWQFNYLLRDALWTLITNFAGT